MKTNLLMAVALSSLSFLTYACGTGATLHPSGYWEGTGDANETLTLNPKVKILRHAKVSLWFTVDKFGDAAGKAEVDYDAELKVGPLGSMNAGPVAINPTVSGKLTDMDPRRTFEIAGRLVDGELDLKLVDADKAAPLQFTIFADPGVAVSMGLSVPSPHKALDGVSRGNVGGIARDNPGEIPIPMKPFDPLHGGSGAAKVEQRPHGPFAAEYESKGTTFVVRWSAHQVSPDEHTIEPGAAMKHAIDQMKAAGGS